MDIEIICLDCGDEFTAKSKNAQRCIPCREARQKIMTSEVKKRIHEEEKRVRWFDGKPSDGIPWKPSRA